MSLGMLRVGLTGGIACGKSHVLRRLELRGCRTLDLDRVAHEVTAPGGSAHADVAAAFGPGVLRPDGAVDRKALGALVFRDPLARERLNRIVHPRVRDEERRRVAALAGGADSVVVVVDAALLVEAGLHLRFDRLVVVHCAPDEQLRRLMERDALSREDAEARLRAQMPVAEKRRFAHLEVDTSGTLADTDVAADALATTLLTLAQRAVERRLVARERLAELLLQHARSAADRQAAARFLEDIAAADGIEMLRVAQLAGRAAGAWLAAPRESTSIAPAVLMPPVSAWCLARRGLDDELLGLAAMSVARAVTAEPTAVAQACLAAWRASREAAGQSAGEARDAVGFARRWSGVEPQGEEPLPVPGGAAELYPAIDRFLAAARTLPGGEG